MVTRKTSGHTLHNFSLTLFNLRGCGTCGMIVLVLNTCCGTSRLKATCINFLRVYGTGGLKPKINSIEQKSVHWEGCSPWRGSWMKSFSCLFQLLELLSLWLLGSILMASIVSSSFCPCAMFFHSQISLCLFLIYSFILRDRGSKLGIYAC